jgi:hypothetical protein
MTSLTQHLKVVFLAEQISNKGREIRVSLQRTCWFDVVYLNFTAFEPSLTFSALVFYLVTLTSYSSLTLLKHLVLNRVARECST